MDDKPSVEEVDHDGESAADRALTRSLLRKLDMRILPPLALLFLCSFLDRTNVGNARLYHLEDDLHISDPQYDQGLAVFYATYIVSEVPSNLVLRRVTPRVWLPLLTAAWGLISMCLGFIQNFAGFVAVRALLGAAEGGLLPGIVLYLSGLYTRQELGLRIGLFYTAASLSGAFGGLLARGLSSLGHRGGLAPWRWIFVLEGLMTVAAAAVAALLLPNGVAGAAFLTPDERAHGVRRLAAAAGPEADEPFRWAEVRRAVFSWQTWLTASAYFGILAGLYSFGLFLPTIVSGLGYTNDEAQLWSVIPYAVASVVTVIVAYISDRFRARGLVMLVTLPVAIAGYAAIANSSTPSVQYGMTILMATGLYSSVPAVLGWLANNSAGHYKRATAAALQLAIANAGGFVTVFIYPKRQGPQYHKGHTIVLSLLVGGWFLVLANVLYCHKINRDKVRGRYDRYRGSGDDREPSFRLVL